MRAERSVCSWKMGGRKDMPSASCGQFALRTRPRRWNYCAALALFTNPLGSPKATNRLCRHFVDQESCFFLFRKRQWVESQSRLSLRILNGDRQRGLVSQVKKASSWVKYWLYTHTSCSSEPKQKTFAHREGAKIYSKLCRCTPHIFDNKTANNWKIVYESQSLTSSKIDFSWQSKARILS